MKSTTHLDYEGRRACQVDAPKGTRDLTRHWKLIECQDCRDAFLRAQATGAARLLDVENFAGWPTVEWVAPKPAKR